MNISLIGYMGSGKSSIAEILAHEMGLKYRDLDAEIEKHTAQTIYDFINDKGEIKFRTVEHQILSDLLKMDGQVLATGGGTPCYFNNIDLLNEASTTIYLQVGVQELYERLEGSQAKRPLITHVTGGELKEYIAKHLFERRPYYERCRYIVKASGKKRDVAEKIKELLI